MHHDKMDRTCTATESRTFKFQVFARPEIQPLRRGAASASSKAAACEPERSRRIGRVTSHDFLRAAASHGEPQSQPTALVTVPSGIRDSSSKTAIRVRLAGGPGLETARRTRMAGVPGVTPWHIPTASSKTRTACRFKNLLRVKTIVTGHPGGQAISSGITVTISQTKQL